MVHIRNLTSIKPQERSTVRVGTRIVVLPEEVSSDGMDWSLKSYPGGRIVEVRFSSYVVEDDNGKRRSLMWHTGVFYKVTENDPDRERSKSTTRSGALEVAERHEAFDAYDMDLAVHRGREGVFALPGRPGSRSLADIADAASKAAVLWERKRLAERLRDRVMNGDHDDDGLEPEIRMKVQDWMFRLADSIEQGMPYTAHGGIED